MKLSTVFKVVVLTFVIVILLILILVIIKSFNRHSSVRRFRQWLKTNPKPNLGDHLKSILRHQLWNDRYTCNHIYEFLVDDSDIPWYRQALHIDSIPLESKKRDDTWKPLYWEGHDSKKVAKISSDGANLILVDRDGRVYYRKVITEKKGEGYKYKEKLSKSNYWFPGWAFTLPLIDHLSWRLRVDPNKPCQISHRGHWNRFILNQETGEKYFEKNIMGKKGGCTTFYYYDGRNIRLADPMSPTRLLIKEKVPEKLDDVRLAPSASTLIYMGRAEDGKWHFWYRIIDIDIKGFVIFLRYYKKCGIEWKQISSIDSLPDESEIGGCKMINLGENRKKLLVWFHTKTQIYRCEYKFTGDWDVQSISK